jgi:hypothetical protein
LDDKFSIIEDSMTTEPELSAGEASPDPEPSLEERLRQRVSMLTQLLIVAGVVVVLQLGIMLKVLIETAK